MLALVGKLARDSEDLEEMLDLALALYPPVPGAPRIPKKPARPRKPVANPRPVTPEREREVHELTKLIIAWVREQHAERQRRLSLPSPSAPY